MAHDGTRPSMAGITLRPSYTEVKYLFTSFAIPNWYTIRAVDFRHIRAFIAVAEEGSVTRAAERLHISQPPLSRYIRQLEVELELQLFDRHRHGARITEGGQQLLDKARTLEAALADFCETASKASHGAASSVRVGIGWGLWDVINRVRAEAVRHVPAMTIEAIEAFCRDQVDQQLHDRALDVVISRPAFDRTYLEVATLFEDRLVAVLSEEHPLASRKLVHLAELAEVPLLLWDRSINPFLYDKMLDLYAKARLTAKTVATPGAGPFNAAGLMMVASGKGMYVGLGVPATSEHPTTGVVTVPIADADATIDVCVVWRKGESSAAVRQFLDCVWRAFDTTSQLSAVS
jgi:DNA-binding transcriptional LysR family regulator